MYRKSLVYLLVLSVLVSFVFSGCREKGANGKKEDFTGVELTYYKMWDDSEILEPIINEYQASHPGLQIHYRKFSDFNEYQRTILNEMAEGEGPDIFSMQNTWFASNYKKISPMPTDFGSPNDFLSLFVDVAYQDLVRTDQNGQLGVMALPMTVDTLALYYNKDHYEDRIPSRGTPADTWEGIKEDVVLLNKEDENLDLEVSGIAMGRADNISRGVDVLYLLMLQYGTKFYNDNMSESIFAGQQTSSGPSNYPGLDALDLYTSFADANQKHYSWNEYIVDDDSIEKE
ncbi:MAG: extracellular solute-binding protein, partial [bacterium]|nr:extracellular solute-binding protein [bacterium]